MDIARRILVLRHHGGADDFAVITIVGTVLLAAYRMHYNLMDPGIHPHFEHVVVIYFMLGCLVYHWREHIPVSPVLFIICLLASYLCLVDRTYTYLAMPFVTYATLFVGMIRFPRIELLQSGDYSYGLYLFGFPITQALAAAVPWFQGHQVPLILAAGILSSLFAWCSWHLVEKHALKLRKKLPERWFPTTPRQREKAVELPTAAS
jgi:peptidoglycan/LPS O-acetylase OafA/YrhL